jgi:hypothetical protein
MARAEKPNPEINAIAILARILSQGKRYSLALSRHLLRLGFSDEDKARMHELAVRNQSGLLSTAELQEPDSYINAGDLLAILHSKARQALKKAAKK